MRRTAAIDSPQLERELLRKGMALRSAVAPCCQDCNRTPLTGERVYTYESGRVVCELCRMLRREAPARNETVHGSEHGQTVRMTVRARAA